VPIRSYSCHSKNVARSGCTTSSCGRERYRVPRQVQPTMSRFGSEVCDRLTSIYGWLTRSSIVHMAKRGFLSAGTFMMIGRDVEGLKRRGPSVRLYKGESVVFKASHGIGHLLHSIYKERARPRPRPRNVKPVDQSVTHQGGLYWKDSRLHEPS
jgi:hypothetical protein